MVNVVMNIFPLKPFEVLPSSFFPSTVHLLKCTLARRAFEAPERVFTVDALRPLSLQYKKDGGTVEIFGSCDKGGFH